MSVDYEKVQSGQMSVEEIQVDDERLSVEMLTTDKYIEELRRELSMFGHIRAFGLPKIIFGNGINRKEVERVLNRLEETGYIAELLRERIIKFRNNEEKAEPPKLIPPIVTYEDDSEEKAGSAQMEGVRDDVYVTTEDGCYKTRFVTLERFEKEMKEAWEKDGFFIPQTNTIIMNDLSKESIEMVAYLYHLAFRAFDRFVPMKK